MEFLSDPNSLSKTFEELCNAYDYFEWVVAWAGKPSGTIPEDILKKHFKKKAEKIIVGLHFYQTHPDFIEKYMRYKSFKFMEQVDGTFHPKLYCFYNNDDDWAILMGSSNLTNAGFNDNTEANILVTSNDSDKAFYKNVKEFIEKIWNTASSFDKEKLDEYTEFWEKQRLHLSSLKRQPKKNGKIATTLFNLMTWKEYEKKVRSCEYCRKRIVLLDKAKKLFDTSSSFAELEVKDRKRLAGVPAGTERMDGIIDWKSFGAMGGNGDFSSAIINYKNNKLKELFHIAQAIDSIPNEGDVTKKKYDDYIDEFKKAFPTTKQNPLATATRLLALKRPDVFVCVDGENKKGLCDKYGIKQSQLNVNTYWELLIERIREDNWFKEDVESDLKKYQVAMLDCIYYV